MAYKVYPNQEGGAVKVPEAHGRGLWGSWMVRSEVDFVLGSGMGPEEDAKR